MSSPSLYNKYRPTAWKDVLGQEHVVDVILGSLKSKGVSHAYLFSGPRGTGKTSVARILAREVGCRGYDLYEMDAASTRGIEDIQSLKEAVSTLPFESAYKVYIIDEVHMLSRPAFDALLKTIESPPSFVIFIFATTELHKVPNTIVSRCQHFSFRKPSEELLKKMILRVAKAEGYEMEKEAASLIAMLGDGSFRDAHGILQKVIGASTDLFLPVSLVLKVGGLPESKIVERFVKALVSKNLEETLVMVKGAVEANIDMKVFIKLILRALRLIMLDVYAPVILKELEEELSLDERLFFEEMKPFVGKTINSSLLLALIEAYEKIDQTSLPQLPLELALIKIIGPLGPDMVGTGVPVPK